MLDLVYQLDGLLIGIIGWAATILLTTNSTKLSALEQRAMVVCSWGAWMLPAAGTLVYREIIATETAIVFCFVTTLLMGVVASIGAIGSGRTRP
jgi:hypothetical protein